MKQEIEAFLDYLAVERRFSENTIAAYKNDLFQLAEFLQEKGERQWAQVDRQLILNYLLSLKERGYALTTLARKTASAKSLFKFLAHKRVVKDAPTENLGSPRVRKTLPRPLSVAQVRELLKQPEKYPTPEARRDKAMLELLYSTGMQVSELMSLNLEDVALQEDSVACSIKGSKERNITVHRGSVPSLQKYLEEARPRLARHQGEKALFLNRLGKRLTRQGFWQILKGYAREAKLDNMVTLRALRHSFAAHSPSPRG
jgi:integrase/recombinase XerD